MKDESVGGRWQNANHHFTAIYTQGVTSHSVLKKLTRFMVNEDLYQPRVAVLQ